MHRVLLLLTMYHSCSAACVAAVAASLLRQVVVATMLEEYTRKLEEFKIFDANGDGELTLDEMRQGLSARQMRWVRCEVCGQ